MPSPPKTKGELGLVTSPASIQTAPTRLPVPEILFSWSPRITVWHDITGFPYGLNQPITGAPAQPTIYLTPGLTNITFTSDVRTPPGDYIIDYEWDFGDGIKAYGPTVEHTYVAMSPSTRIVLCIIDNHGRRFCRGQQANLKPASLGIINPAISAAP